MAVAQRRAEGSPGAGARRGGAGDGMEITDEAGGATPSGRAERIVLGAETGLRRFVRSAAILLWIPCGFFFWLPFLFRRTVSYVFALLYAGLTGGQAEDAERRWEQAVGFFQTGFLRILHAFRPEEPEASPGARAAATRSTEPRARRFVLESAWAVLVWGAVVWLLGIWPDAPETLRSAALGAWDTLAAAGREIDGAARSLLGR